ncbi:uncharacterized protein K444DRAFT_610007 [Hyaloscypha bicolor E]|uniref:Uncharacterized protein n=1 Tax=Hyaloscypha bicolor E TaxID=1095630 RepID=A0A2J6TJD6_9HELO|nr:uncharacterized protein K444DRAFT_610007 [Hyaloscypha bicolor E]PMD63131.1 hypothetical protein K444DRAFT_610007 [Hyaloscypha bicolor E]
MRLLNIETMRMEEFFDEREALYAILSHRWGQEEVSLQEWNRVQEIEARMRTITTHHAFKAPRHENDYYHESLREQYYELEEEKAAVRKKTGYSKIVSCIEMARNQKISRGEKVHSCSFVWIDTCCIDKTSNAELSEAINSMFRWYHNALVCLVYLADVPTNLGQDEMESKIRKSNWFERGWTLQELLAPRTVCFFDQGWKFLFNKEQKCALLENITHIDRNILRGFDMSRACTAKKMSWAASRTTTRKEDIAYCLLGIFDVNMPLLYGEGDKAFARLQEEIIRQSGDLSIFAWGYNSSGTHGIHGIFAPSPAYFIGCYNLHGLRSSQAVISMANITLSVKLSYLRPKTDRLSFMYAYLCCSEGTTNQIVLPLVMNRSGGHLQFGEDATRVWFERPAGARPILMSATHEMDDKIWMHESRTISILKKGGEENIETLGKTFFVGLHLPSSKAAVDEIYPPHFWGRVVVVSDFRSPVDRRIWYPGAIERDRGVDPGEPGYETLAYIRISHRRNGAQMVLIVRRLDSTPRDLEVRVAKWPIRGCVSLADFALRDDLNRRYEGRIEGLDLSVKRRVCISLFENSWAFVITIWAPGDANGRSKKNINNIEAQEIEVGSNGDDEAMGNESDSYENVKTRTTA